MSIRNNDKLWKFIKENHATLDAPSHLLCTLCHKLIINSRKTPCQCKYCAECISNYLEDGVKTCCGNTYRCYGLKLNLKKDIKGDYETNLEIGDLTVKCPRMSCYYYNKIWEVYEHSTVCTNNSTNNTQQKLQWGCEIANGFQSFYDKVIESNTDEINSIKSILSTLMKEKSSETEKIIQENKYQLEEIKKLTTKITKMEIEINELKSTKKRQNVEMDRLNKSNATLRKNLNDFIAEVRENKLNNIDEKMIILLDPFKQNMESINSEIGKLKKYHSQFEKRLEKEYSSTFKNINAAISQLEVQCENNCFNIRVLAFKLETLAEHHSNLQECASFPFESVTNTQEEITKFSVCMYTWKVNNFSAYKSEAVQKRNRKLTSKDFHSSDKSYKIHFDLYPCGYGEGEGRYLSMFAVIKKTNEKGWTGALSYDITVSIESNGQKLHTKKLTKLQNKGKDQTSDIDHCVGVEKMVEINEVFEEPSLMDNNSMTFVFIVKNK